MKKISILLLVFGFSTTFMYAQYFQNVGATEFAALLKNDDGVLLDVRTTQEYSRGHIKNSTLISTNDPKFVNKVSLLQKDKPIYVYCLTGSRSSMVANYLSKKGYTKVYNLSRGIMDWQQNHYDLEVSSNAVKSASPTLSSAQFEQILNNNNLVLVDFYTPWCVPCKKMSPVMDELKQDHSDKVMVQKIDIEANETLKGQYNVESIPGFVLFKSGKEVWRHNGVITKDALEKIILAHAK